MTLLPGHKVIFRLLRPFSPENGTFAPFPHGPFGRRLFSEANDNEYTRFTVGCQPGFAGVRRERDLPG